MGASAVKCCSAKEAQTADTMVEAAGEESPLYADMPDALKKDVGISSDGAKEVPEEFQEINAEPDSEPLIDSAAEEQTDQKHSEEGRQIDSPGSCATPAPEFEVQSPTFEGVDVEKNEDEPTTAPLVTEKTSAEDKTVTEKVEDPAKTKEPQSSTERQASGKSKAKKKADKEHSKPAKGKEAKGTDDSKKSKNSAKRTAGADDFKVLEGKDAFVGSDADAMKALDIDQCKQKCRERGYGAFIVWEGVACFRTQSGEECLNNLVDAPTATLYVYIPDVKKKQEEQKSMAKQEEEPTTATDKEKKLRQSGGKTKTEKMETAPQVTPDVSEEAKVDEAAKKRERKEAWKQMSETEKKEKGSALLAAAKAGKAADVKKLLEENVSPDYIDGDGWCGLHFAAQEGKLDVAEVLLRYDADPTLQIKLGEWGHTPLHYAARNGHREVAEKLVAADKKGKAARTKQWKGKLPHELASGSFAKWLKGVAKGS